jgi:hypothetical protein
MFAHVAQNFARQENSQCRVAYRVLHRAYIRTFQETHTLMQRQTKEPSLNILRSHSRHRPAMSGSRVKRDWPLDHRQMQGQSNLYKG